MGEKGYRPEEEFDPTDEKYKKVADLPEEEQGKYVDSARVGVLHRNEGFIKKEAAESDDSADEAARAANRESQGSRVNAMDILHQEAIVEKKKARSSRRNKTGP